MNKDYNTLNPEDYEPMWETQHDPLKRLYNSDIPNPYLHSQVHGTGMDSVTSNQNDNPYIFDPSNKKDLINFSNAVIQLKQMCEDDDDDAKEKRDYHKIISSVFNYIDLSLAELPSEDIVRRKYLKDGDLNYK